MAHPPTDKATVDTILRLRREGKGVSEIAREVKVHRGTAHRILRQYAEGAGRIKPDGESGPPPDKRGATDSLDMDGTCDLVTEDRPATIEEVMAACKVDPKVWVAKHYRPNCWQGFYKLKEGAGHRVVRLFQSRVAFERVMPACMEAAILEFVREHVPAKPLFVLKPKKADGFMVSWGIYDAHIGMFAWNEEVGESYDVNIARTRVMNSIDDMVLELAKYPIEKIIMPVGNDFMHFDSVRRQTAFGEHHLDNDSRFAKAYRTALSCLVHMVERALEISQKIEVVYVPGNHDITTSFTLCVALKEHFRDTPRVDFDIAACPRKYKQFGGVVILYDHGNDVRPDQYPRIFSQEARKLWAESTYREVQCGHFHQRRERVYEGVVPTNGLLVRTNPALTNTDQWHFKQALIGEPVKSVEAWRYDKIGYRGSHVVWARDEAIADLEKAK